MNAEYYASAIERLQEKGIVFEDGLSQGEIELVEGKFGFIFPPDLKAFLQTALPVSLPFKPGSTYANPFPNWRSENEAQLRERLNWPSKGICFDIENNEFWMDSWGIRPDSDEAACAKALEKVNQAPTLIPIYGHRYMPDAPQSVGNPIYSVWQTDIIYYGFDLPRYLENEFKIAGPTSQSQSPKRIDFWSELPYMWIPEWY